MRDYSYELLNSYIPNSKCILYALFVNVHLLGNVYKKVGRVYIFKYTFALSFLYVF